MAGRADRTAEDTVEYRLFPEIPDGLGEKETQKFLEETLDSYLVHLSRFLVDYIWQCEPFHMAVVAGTSGLGPPHLYGKTRYGDNVEDEWFIVYILCQLTQNFSGLVARVYDTDGEFLLIEAANHLPKWLNPDTSENRIFLYRGKLHIIPQPQTPAEITTLPAGIPQVGQALHCIREYPRLTLASDAIQQDIHRRKEGYPGKVAQFRHRAHCYLPAPLAAVLDKNPALVAPMVQAFYLRDPIDLKACVTMKHFRPGTRVVRETEHARTVGKLKNSLVKTITIKDSTGDMKCSLWGSAANGADIELGQQIVLSDTKTYMCNITKEKRLNVNNADQIQVKFTKCLYAQMMQQRFTPDKRSGWNLLPTSNPKYKTHDLGMKLAHGAEILCANCGGETSNTNKNQSRNPALDTRWQHFKAALTQKGYFRGEIEGSRLYTKLADDARAFYYSSGNAETGDQDGPDAGRQILRVLRTVDYDIEEMRKEEVDLAPPDDDSWLDVSPEQLDDMLNRASDFPSPTAGGSNPFDMAGMADSMKAFVENISSHEGAEFPKTSEDSDIQFDPNSFIQTMQKMFEFEDSASDSSTDMSEYGSDDELGSDTSPPSSRPTERPKPPPRPKKESRSQEASPKKLPESTHEDYLGMQEYMKRMDQELATTTIGQSFETKAAAPEKKPRPSRPPPPRPTSGPPRRPTTAPPPPPRRTAPRATLDDDLDMDDDEDEDDFEPVDIDLNMVKNLLESYGAQDGLAGPTSNVLGAMGIPLPKNKDK